MKQATSDGIPIRYDDYGSGDTALLCLPGWCVPRTLFAPLAQAVGDRMRVLALDWRGHGESGAAHGEFGARELADDALAVLAASGARRVVPLAQAHAGWIALELRRRLGTKVAAMVFTSWLMLDPPPPFMSTLEALQDPARWQNAREQLLAIWLHQAPPEIADVVQREARTHDHAMWARAAREIGSAYKREGSALRALGSLEPPTPALHVYAQPASGEFLDAQRAFARENEWFDVERIDATSHFPTLEVPQETALAIARFLTAVEVDEKSA